MNKETLAELKAKHKHLYLLQYSDENGDEQTLAFTRMRRVQYLEYMATITEDRSRLASAQEQVFRDCVVWPPRELHDDVLELQPGLPIVVCGRALALASGEVANSVKKA